MKPRIVASLLAIAFTPIGALAGDLNPPAGPIAPTAKPLAEIEPRTAINSVNTPGDPAYTYIISQPGSYYLTEPLDADTNVGGIRVTSAHVTIDLNGFRINSNGSIMPIHGIDASGRNQITVRNGTVQNFSDTGIIANLRCVVEDVRVVGNASAGVFLGSDSIIRNCIARQNGTGLRIDTGGLIDGCIADFNSFDGILAQAETVVTDCRAYRNLDNGIEVYAGTIVSGCTAGSNTSAGIEFSGDAYIVQNVCVNNEVGIAGSVGGSRARIDSNHCTNNDVGIDIDAISNIVIRNTADANITSNYDIVAGNFVGTLSPSPVGAGPWDNFDY